MKNAWQIYYSKKYSNGKQKDRQNKGIDMFLKEYKMYVCKNVNKTI